jgi:protein SCO1
MALFQQGMLRGFVGALLIVVAGACSRDAGDERVFTVRGIVRGAYQEGAIVIQHEEIPNFMPAMTMPFYVDEPEARNLVPGDRVEFEFRVGETSRATRFRKLGRVETPVASPATVGRLRDGDLLPAFSLVDQDGHALDESALRGRYTVVTFIFTRCPVPEFCPLIARKFQSLQAELRSRPGLPASDVQLLSLTLDPEFDRPSVLRAYGESLGADFRRWRFGTGESAEIERLTRLFAVRTERNAASLDHTLATALIGPDGRLVAIWRGNAWKPDDVLAKLSGLTPE